MDKIQLQLDETESTVLAQALHIRMLYLAEQPQSAERDGEMSVITTICQRCAGEIRRVMLTLAN